MSTRIFLKREMFGPREFVLVDNGSMKATTFCYSTGVEAIKVENQHGYFILLPFKGQQIWRLHFCGKDLHMKTMMDEPQQTKVYLDTYGAFLLHCGMTGMGKPARDDEHEQHGELPSADYQMAYLECGDDYMEVGGRYDYDKSFVRNYSFEPSCRLYENDTVLKISCALQNRRYRPLEYMYLCHINFRPIDGAKILASSEYQEANLVGEGDQSIYDPEVCFSIAYCSDKEGRAYTLQYDKEGACYVNHPADVLPYGVRWISRTGNEDSMGMVLPATAEPNGYLYAKEHGQIKEIGGNERLEFYIEAGYISKEEADKVCTKIENIMRG